MDVDVDTMVWRTVRAGPGEHFSSSFRNRQSFALRAGYLYCQRHLGDIMVDF